MKYPKNWTDYELIDFGDGRKLERFGKLIVHRPEPSATSKPSSLEDKWNNATLYFQEEKGQKGSWNKHIDDFNIEYPFGNHFIKFKLSQGVFKHLGVFPEQAENWEFIKIRCQKISKIGITPKVLNLFAYTGGASFAASLAGAEVTHVDSSKSAVNRARENAGLNGIDNIRWIVDDARKFVQKSIRRGDVYNGIIMDPPIFGLGSRGKNWKLTRDLQELLRNTVKVLHPEHRFFILNTYSPQLSLSKLNLLLSNVEGFPEQFESTMLGLKDSSGKQLELGNLIRF